MRHQKNDHTQPPYFMNLLLLPQPSSKKEENANEQFSFSFIKTKISDKVFEILKIHKWLHQKIIWKWGFARMSAVSAAMDSAHDILHLDSNEKELKINFPSSYVKMKD